MAVIWLANSVVQNFIVEAESKYPNESGGVLMGHWTSPYEEAVVTHAIGPGPNAIHRPTKFTPDGKYHWDMIADIFMATKGRTTYLGDWHSHPLGGSRLSQLDRSTLKKIASTPESQMTHPLMMILAGGEKWSIHAWMYDPRSWRGRKLGRSYVLQKVSLLE